MSGYHFRVYAPGEQRPHWEEDPLGWSQGEDEHILMFRSQGLSWEEMSIKLWGRPPAWCEQRWHQLTASNTSRQTMPHPNTSNQPQHPLHPHPEPSNTGTRPAEEPADGPWTDIEDSQLRRWKTEGRTYGWISSQFQSHTPQACQNRFHNTPAVPSPNSTRRPKWTADEDSQLVSLVQAGKDWAEIGEAIEERNAEACKSRWYKYLAKAHTHVKPRGSRKVDDEAAAGVGSSSKGV